MSDTRKDQGSSRRDFLKLAATSAPAAVAVVATGVTSAEAATDAKPVSGMKDTAQTRAYIADLRAKMAAHIDGGGDIMGAAQVDQSAFAELPQFEQLAGRNAQAVFQAMEWE